MAPEVLYEPPSKYKRAQGRPGASSHPRPVCIGRKHTVVTTGGAGSSGLPCAMVLTVTSWSPRGPGSFAPVVRGLLHDLSASVGAPGPHDFAVRVSAARLASLTRPPHPASTSVTIAIRPSCEGGTVRTLRLIWVSEKAKYFLRRDWTGFCGREVICPSGNSLAFSATALAARDQLRRAPIRSPNDWRATSAHVQVFGRRHDERFHALWRPASKNLHMSGSLPWAYRDGLGRLVGSLAGRPVRGRPS
jgi:hypothetical protein